MKNAAKSIAEAPVLGQVLLQLFLKVKETQNEECKAQLREQETIGLLRQKELECLLYASRVAELEAQLESL